MNAAISRLIQHHHIGGFNDSCTWPQMKQFLLKARRTFAR
jgi:hypothetical protein